MYLILQIFNCYKGGEFKDTALSVFEIAEIMRWNNYISAIMTLNNISIHKNLGTSTFLWIYRWLNHVGQTNVLANALRDWKWLTLYWVCINCRAKDVEPRWSTNRWQWRWDDQQNDVGPTLLCVICCRTVSRSYKIGLQT